jgi:histidinol-phosphate aminotransferase
LSRKKDVNQVLTLVKESLRDKEPYAGGKQIDDYSKWIKLNQNEAPYGPAQIVLDAIDKSKKYAHRYPPGDHKELREKGAKFYNINPDQISFADGSDETLEYICLVFLERGDLLCYSKNDYSMWDAYRRLVNINNAIIIELPDGYSLPVDEIIKIRPKLVLYSNPNTPSGILTPTKKIKRLVEELYPNIVVQDEAYGEFADESGIDLIKKEKYPNLIITRTLSKAHGLAGFRIGYCIGHPEIISRIEATRLPYNLNIASYNVALAAFDEEALKYTAEKVEMIKNERSKLSSALNELGFYVRPSQTNFVLARTDSPETAKLLYEKLEENHILVRYFETGRLSDCLRITVGLPEENNKLIEGLKEILKDISGD